MHHALVLEEILANIFFHFHPEDSTLIALARTCRAFKEPALDALWRTLTNLNLIVRCLPKRHLSSKPLSQSEWDVLVGYTRRVQRIDVIRGPSEETSQLLSNLPTAEPLLPNLRHLSISPSMFKITMLLLRSPLPSLTFLQVTFESPRLIQTYIDSFSATSPNIRTLEIGHYGDMWEGIVESNFLRCWQNLRYVAVGPATLGKDAFQHLSNLPALTHLDIKLSPMSPTFASPLLFPNLTSLMVRSVLLRSVTQFFAEAQLPAMKELGVTVMECPSTWELSSFWTRLLGSNAGHTIKELHLSQTWYLLGARTERGAHIELKDLWPCMNFKHMCHFWLELDCDIFLSNSDLLTLASAWPELEEFVIRDPWDWRPNSQYGITPGGLVQLLQVCPSLDRAILRLDTRGYTEVSPDESPAALALRDELRLNVIHSDIEEESVPAITSFLSGLSAACSRFYFKYEYSTRGGYPRYRRWRDVYRWLKSQGRVYVNAYEPNFEYEDSESGTDDDDF